MSGQICKYKHKAYAPSQSAVRADALQGWEEVEETSTARPRHGSLSTHSLLKGFEATSPV